MKRWMPETSMAIPSVASVSGAEEPVCEEVATRFTSSPSRRYASRPERWTVSIIIADHLLLEVEPYVHGDISERVLARRAVRRGQEQGTESVAHAVPEADADRVIGGAVDLVGGRGEGHPERHRTADDVHRVLSPEDSAPRRALPHRALLEEVARNVASRRAVVRVLGVEAGIVVAGVQALRVAAPRPA